MHRCPFHLLWLLVALGLAPVASACQTTSPSSSMAAAADSDQDLVRVVQRAVEVDYRESILPPDMTPGALSPRDVTNLRASIDSAYSESYAGHQLSDRIAAMEHWVDMMSVNPGLRSAVAELRSFTGRVETRSESSATVDGNYTVYQVNEKGIGSDLARWGGTLAIDFVANLRLLDGRWLVVDLGQEQVGFDADPSIGASPGAT
jgi:hypothetical protein